MFYFHLLPSLKSICLFSFRNCVRRASCVQSHLNIRSFFFICVGVRVLVCVWVLDLDAVFSFISLKTDSPIFSSSNRLTSDVKHIENKVQHSKYAMHRLLPMFGSNCCSRHTRSTETCSLRAFINATNSKTRDWSHAIIYKHFECTHRLHSVFFFYSRFKHLTFYFCLAATTDTRQMMETRNHFSTSHRFYVCLRRSHRKSARTRVNFSNSS